MTKGLERMDCGGADFIFSALHVLPQFVEEKIDGDTGRSYESIPSITVRISKKN
jgi:hypothetical protein